MAKSPGIGCSVENSVQRSRKCGSCPTTAETRFGTGGFRDRARSQHLVDDRWAHLYRMFPLPVIAQLQLCIKSLCVAFSCSGKVCFTHEGQYNSSLDICGVHWNLIARTNAYNNFTIVLSGRAGTCRDVRYDTGALQGGRGCPVSFLATYVFRSCHSSGYERGCPRTFARHCASHRGGEHSGLFVENRA